MPQKNCPKKAQTNNDDKVAQILKPVNLNKYLDSYVDSTRREYANVQFTQPTQQQQQVQPVQPVQPVQQTTNDILVQYINLMIDKQSFTSLKLDNIETLLSKVSKENVDLKDTLKILERQTELLSNQLDDALTLLSSDRHYTINVDDDNIGDTFQTCGDPYCEYCTSCNSDNMCNKLCDNESFDNEHQKSKKSKKSKKHKKNDNDIIVKVQGDFPLGSMGSMGSMVPIESNPLKMIMDQLTGVQQNKKNARDEDIYSDDGYDQNAPIYETIEDDKCLDANFVELSDKITNIKDLIDIGEKYSDLVNLSKQKNTNKKNKKNKKNNKNKSQKTQNINCVDYNNESVQFTQEIETMGCYELDGKKYPINLETIGNLSAPLKRLSKMIGMNKVKEDIFDMIIYYLQGFEKNNNNMLHSVIEGPPGVGKTKLGKILAGVYCGLGIIPSNRFKYVKATDLIGDHVGATKHMTQEVIDEADGGVLFIDEAYALSSNDNKDPYGKECIDTINFNLSENKKKLIVIIAGYPDHLDKYFFSFNPGLARRFPFKFRIDAYTADELKEIFIDKLRKFGWKFRLSVTTDKLNSFFKTNEKEFPNYGGDIENFFKSCQFAHSKRMIGKNPNQRRKFDFDDIKGGLEKFKKNKRNNEDKSQIWKDMFV